MGHMEDIDVILNAYTENFEVPLKRAEASVRSFQLALKRFSTTLHDKWSEDINKSIKTLKKQNAEINKSKHMFAGWAMSIMFFGMALRRTFDKIWTSGTSKFQDVMHSVEGTVTGFDRLNASTDILKFSIGAALEPVTMMLVPIIDKISQWVEKNPVLVRTTLLLAGALGTLFAVGGGLVLAFNGFAEAIGLAAISTETLATAFAVLTSTPALVGGVLALLGIAAYKTDFAGFRDAFNKTFNTIKTTFSNIFKDIKSIFKGVWDIIVGSLSDDDNKVKKGFTELWNGLIGIVKEANIMLFTIVSNIGIFILNIFTSSITDLTKKVMDYFYGFRSIIKLFDKIMGTNYLSSWDTSWEALDKKITSSLKVDYLSREDAAKHFSYFDKFKLSMPEEKGTTIVNNYYSAAPTEYEEMSGYGSFTPAYNW